MPQLHIPNGYAQNLIRFSLVGDPQEMAVTIGAEGTVGATAAQIAEDLDDMLTAPGSLFADSSSIREGYTYVGVTTRLQTATGMEVAEELANVPGTGVGGTLPPNSAFLVRKITASAGRAGRGRMFLPPYRTPEENIDANGFLDPADVLALQNELDAFHLAIAASDEIEDLVLFHYETDPPTNPAPTPISAFAVQRQIATRRLRLRP